MKCGAARDDEAGVALVLAVFVLVLLAAAGFSLALLSQGEVGMARSSVRASQTFYLAEAGVERGRLALSAAVEDKPADEALKTAFGGNQILEFDPQTLKRRYAADGKLVALEGYGDDRPLVALSTLGLEPGATGSYAAFLTNDPIEDDETIDTNDRVMVTGVGVGPEGSFEIAQAILEKEPGTLPGLSATIMLLGPHPAFDGGSSASMKYWGDDCAGAGDPSIHVPTIGVFGPEAQAAAAAGIGKPASYKSGGYTGSDTIVDLNTAGPLVGGAADPTWTECQELRSLMSRIKTHADVVCGAYKKCDLPASTPERIVFVEGDYAAPSGTGLLAVTGVLTVGMSWKWDGFVLVVGKGDMRRTGGGSGHISGGIVIADIAGPDEVLFTADDCTAEPDGFADSSFETSGGGNSTTSFCLKVLAPIKIDEPYRVVDFLQR